MHSPGWAALTWTGLLGAIGLQLGCAQVLGIDGYSKGAGGAAGGGGTGTGVSVGGGGTGGNGGGANAVVCHGDAPSGGDPVDEFMTGWHFFVGGDGDDSVDDLVWGLETGSIRYTGTLGGDGVLHSKPGADVSDVQMTDVFVASARGDAEFLWHREFAGSQNQWADELVWDHQGVTAVGRFEGIVDFNGRIVNADGTQAGFVARFDPGGPPSWAVMLRSTHRVADPVGVARDEENTRSLVVGGYAGELSLDAAVPYPDTTEAIAGLDIFVVAVSHGGEVQAVESFGGSGQDQALAATSHQGSSYVAASFSADWTLGGEVLDSQGETDGLVIKLDENLAPLWTFTFGGAGPDRAEKIAVAQDGSVVVLGTIYGAVDVASGCTLGSGNKKQSVVIKLDPISGDPQLVTGISGPGDVVGVGLATDANGNIAVGGSAIGGVRFGDKALIVASSNSGTEGFAVTLSPDGVPSRGVLFGGLGEDMVEAVLLEDGGNVLVGGWANGDDTFFADVPDPSKAGFVAQLVLTP